MRLARERQRGEHERGGEPAVPLDEQEAEGEQERDRAQQMAGALRDSVRSERERQPADERGAARQAQLAEPPRRQRSRRYEGEQEEDVVGDDGAEERVQGPVERREEPALEIDRAVGFRLEGVRIEPRGAGVRELVTGQPHRPAELEVVAGGCLSEAGARAGEIAVSEPPDGGPGGEQSRREPEGQDERYEARTSASKLSKSGTSESAYRHVRRTVPPSPTRIAARSGTSASPRHSRRRPNRRASSPFQSERSGVSIPSTSFQARCEKDESRETPKTRTPAAANSGSLSRRSRSSCVQVRDQSKR